MKKRIQIVLLFIMILIISTGCQKNDAASEGTAISLFDIFPQELGLTQYYEGTLDYGAYETIVNVEEKYKDEASELIYIEGKEEDLSGGEAGDTSYLKKIKVNEESIQLVFGDQDITLIKGPIVIGNEWETLWYNRSYGFLEAQCTITDMTENIITVETIPIHENQLKNYKEVCTYEVGKGLVSKTTSYPLNENEEEAYEYSKWLYKTSEIPDEQFIQRYVNPEVSLKPFYRQEDTYYKSIIAETKRWLRQKENLTDVDILKKYKSILNSLSENDLKSISTAKETGYLLGRSMKNSGELVSTFEVFYEELIDILGAQWLNENLTYETIDKIYMYDDAHRYHMRPLYDIKDRVDKVKATVLYENGISVAFCEGMPYLNPAEDYVYKNFSAIAPNDVTAYLQLKKWRYLNEPLRCEGYLTVAPDAIADYIVALEKYYNKYPDSFKADWAKDQAKIFINLYVIPSKYNFSLYNNGVLNTEHIKSYERFIEKYEDSSYYPLIQNTYQRLSRNGFFYNKALDNYLKEAGYEPSMDDEIYQSIEEQSLQMKDFNTIIETPVASELDQNDRIVTVENGKEFLEALAPDTTVVLEAGKYVLPNSYTSENVNIEYGQLNIVGLNNLVIEGKGDMPVTMMSEAYGYVFKFDDCKNITISNLRVGHIQLYCKAGVIYMNNCEAIKIDRSILYGCGEWGLEVSNSNDLRVSNTLIADCTKQAVRLENLEEATFINSMFKRNGKNVVYMDSCENVKYEQIEITENKKQTNGKDSIFALVDNSQITIKACVINDNLAEALQSGDSNLIIEEENIQNEL